MNLSGGQLKAVFNHCFPIRTGTPAKCEPIILLHVLYVCSADITVLSKSVVIVESDVSLSTAVRPTDTSDISLVSPTHALSK